MEEKQTSDLFILPSTWIRKPALNKFVSESVTGFRTVFLILFWPARQTGRKEERKNSREAFFADL